MVRISLVVPAYNEAAWLPALLDSVEVARRRYRGGADAIEVVVADNASTDGTAEIARARGCRVVRVEKRSIAAARNGGARAASGGIVAFIDADSRIHPETFDVIDRTLATGRVVVGATGVRMSRMSLGIGLTYWLTKLGSRIAGLDTGVVFCRREDWERVGGYDETRLWAEDVGFLVALKRLGRARGQRFAVASGAPAITSARKYDRFGDWHCFAILLGRPWLLFSANARERFVRDYWYGDRGAP